MEPDVNESAVENDTNDTPESSISHDEEIAVLTDKLARARADYVNLEKRVARDAALERERVRARVLEGFLQVFEFGKMAQVEATKSPGPLADGVSMLVREFERLLSAEGVEMFGAVGETFDGSMHEAISAEEGEAGKIARVVTPGYRLGERILRYAKVVVGE